MEDPSTALRPQRSESLGMLPSLGASRECGAPAREATKRMRSEGSGEQLCKHCHVGVSPSRPSVPSVHAESPLQTLEVLTMAATDLRLHGLCLHSHSAQHNHQNHIVLAPIRSCLHCCFADSALSASVAPADLLSPQPHTPSCADDGSDSETVTVSGPAPQQRGHARSCSWPRYQDKQHLLRLVGEHEPRSAEDWEVGLGFKSAGPCVTTRGPAPSSVLLSKPHTAEDVEVSVGL